MIAIKNRWTGNVIIKVENLSGADLSGADLSGANLSGANLRNADLRNADLSRADLSRANLSSADLSDADLSDADLSDADLSGADLSGANLSGSQINWQSHDLIAEILRRSADSIDREMVAGFVLISRDRCWSDFLKFSDHPEFPWAIGVLREWAKGDSSAPKILRETD